MSLDSTLRQLDTRITETVEKAVRNLREEITRKLRDGHGDLLRRIEEVTVEMPDSFVDPEVIDAMVAEEARGAVADAGGDDLGRLRDSVAALDRARSQKEVLEALLDECLRFASRGALFLLRSGQVMGWGGRGLGESAQAIRGLRFGPGDDPAFTRLVEKPGVLVLDAPECAGLASRLESPVPHGGVLLPLVLRDKVAAALYADRMEGEALGIEALQILVHTAAQAIETLPFRQREATPTLYVERAAEQGEAEETAAGETEPAALPAEEAREPAAPAVEAAAPEPAMEVEEEEEAAEEAGLEAEEDAAPWVVEDVEAEEEETTAERDTAAPEPAMVESLAWEAEETGGEEDFVEAEEEAPAATTTPTTLAWEEPAAEEVPAQPSAEEVRVEAVSQVEESSPAGDAATQLLPQTPAPEAPSTGEDDATVLLPRTPPPPPPAEPEAEEAEEEDDTQVRQAAEGAESAEHESRVAPPSDVDGPGWAFSGREERSADEEAAHQAARRLARLLISEIKLYNEEEVEEGRRKGDVYERLRADIDRSRQVYEERVDEGVRASNDYFYQEMVRLLGAGDPKALGI